MTDRGTWEIRDSFGVKVSGGIRSDLEAIDWAIELNVWNFTVRPEVPVGTLRYEKEGT